jgi:hypothetical protein
MRFRQAYRVVLGAFLLAGAAAQAEDRSANQVLLAPGKSMTFSDVKNPGINVVVTAPADAYLNLSQLVAASEKAGIYTLMTTVQIKAAGSIVSNADGSLSLRPASGQSYFVPKDAAAGPGRITLEGGIAVLDRGRAVIHSDSIVHARPAAAASAVAPTAAPVVPTLPPTSVAGAGPRPNVPMPTATVVPTGAVSINPNIAVNTGNITFQSFNIGSGTSVNITQPLGGVTTLQNAQGGAILPVGTLTTTGGIKPPAPVIVTPR